MRNGDKRIGGKSERIKQAAMCGRCQRERKTPGDLISRTMERDPVQRAGIPS